MPMMTRLHRPRLAGMRKTVRPHLPRLTGAWSWRRQGLIPLEELRASERLDVEFAGLVDPLSADRLYERRWALTLMEQVLGRLKTEYRATGNETLFNSLKQLLSDEPGTPARAEIAARL